MSLRPIELLAAEHAALRDATLARDAARRRTHGIVHTPAELARAVLRVSDELLRERIRLPRGLAAADLLLLDPACGPGAFLAAALALAEDRECAPLRALGFDVDAAALASAARLLEHPKGGAIELVEADVLATEVLSERAREHAGPLLLLGNPPWTTARSQPSALDQARLAGFRADASGSPLRERKLGVLSDRYVRFFALCAQVARDCEAGAVVALVTNGSFLDGPVHRGMRARLLAWFDEVAVLDLGGSALLGRRRERRDDNVFGVRPNVAVTWLCRYPQRRRGVGQGHARYARRYGTKAEKLAFLRSATLAGLGLAEHACEPPAHGFVPRPRQDARYASFPALSEWLPFHREGVQSNRDRVVVDSSRERLLSRLRAFERGESLPELAQAYRVLSHYDPERARCALRAALEQDPSAEAGLVLRPIAYRPLDERVFCPVAPLCHRPRPELEAALAHGGFALVSVRKDRGDLRWTHAAAAACTPDNCLLSARSSCRARAFPTYTPLGAENLAPRMRERLAAVGCADASPQAVQHYLLSVLSAASYRDCWDSELHHDYPRVPTPPDAPTFQRLAALGERLAVLHTAPCGSERTAPEPGPGMRFGDIVLDLRQGQLRAGDVALISVNPRALSLRIGHHRPLAVYLSQRAHVPLDAAGLSAVYARVERLEALAQLHEDVDSAFVDCFGRCRRG